MIPLAVGATLFAASLFALQHGAEARATAESRLDEVRNHYLRGKEEHRLRQTYEPPFRQLRDTGLVNGDPRQKALASARRLAAALALPSAHFETDSAEPFPIGDAGVGAWLVAHPVIARLGLVHEGQLLDFLKRLRASSAAPVSTRGCDLERTARASFISGAQNLTARCELLWITVRMGETGEGETE